MSMFNSPSTGNRVAAIGQTLLETASGLAVSGVILFLIGIDPFAALWSLLHGAFGYPEAIGYTLYYTTTYIFAGLAVWLGLRAGLFNIGGEGQIYIGGLGAGLACMLLAGMPGWIVAPVACVTAMVFGGAWAFLPALLLARRGSSLVVTTIMFNFIAAALMTWLLTSVMIKPGQAAPETASFDPALWMPSFSKIAGAMGVTIAKSPANVSLLLALGAVALAHILVRRTVWGYEFRVLGGLCRDQGGTHRHRCHVSVRRLRWIGRGKRDHGRASPPDPRFSQRRRVRRHSGRAHGGAKQRLGDCAGSASVRGLVSGQRRPDDR
jgi:ABC-type uncharacterized transport system permease subunit